MFYRITNKTKTADWKPKCHGMYQLQTEGLQKIKSNLR